MKPPTVTTIVTLLLQAALLLGSLFLAVHVIPLTFGQRTSREALKPEATKAAAAMKASAKADVLLVNQAPNITAAGSKITAEGCFPVNAAIDPGETVTVELKLMNGGDAATTNLVATLQVGGGVTNPSGPQNYGVISPGGMAKRSFSFTADSVPACGATITATLQLNDNGNPLPNVQFTFITGALVASASENFDGVTAPALPAGWTA